MNVKGLRLSTNIDDRRGQPKPFGSGTVANMLLGLSERYGLEAGDNIDELEKQALTMALMREFGMSRETAFGLTDSFIHDVWRGDMSHNRQGRYAGDVEDR